MKNVCAIKGDGTLWSWGIIVVELVNGMANAMDRSSPVQIGTGHGIDMGGLIDCAATKSDGTMWAWEKSSW